MEAVIEGGGRALAAVLGDNAAMMQRRASFVPGRPYEAFVLAALVAALGLAACGDGGTPASGSGGSGQAGANGGSGGGAAGRAGTGGTAGGAGGSAARTGFASGPAMKPARASAMAATAMRDPVQVRAIDMKSLVLGVTKRARCILSTAMGHKVDG